MSRKDQVTFSSNPTRASRHAHAQARQMFREYDTSSITPKQSKLPLIFGILIAVVVTLLIVFLVMHFFLSSGTGSDELLPQGESTTITVVAGDTASLIAVELKRAGLITNTDKFIRRVAARGVENQLQAGSYTLTGGMSVDEIITALTSGAGRVGVAMLIPEGYTLAQIAAAVQKATAGRIVSADFIEAAQAPRWAEEFSFTAHAGDNSLEGFLFPATYDITEEMTADDIIRRMLTKFKEEINGLDLSVPEEAGLTWYQWLILASIVQGETAGGDEDLIAGVFYNRLRDNIPLQSCATTAYVVGREPTDAELHDYSDPYNTYSYDRLGVCIPTPIGNPGFACLEAAAKPAATSYYYFYSMPDENGGRKDFFSETYEEHLALIASDNS